MKIVLRLVGGLFVLTGLVWILQGAGVLPGSPMTGQLVWLFAGIIGLAAGVGLIAWGGRDASG